MFISTLVLLFSLNAVLGQLYPYFFDANDLKNFGYLDAATNPNPISRPTIRPSSTIIPKTAKPMPPKGKLGNKGISGSVVGLYHKHKDETRRTNSTVVNEPQIRPSNISADYRRNMKGSGDAFAPNLGPSIKLESKESVLANREIWESLNDDDDAPFGLSGIYKSNELPSQLRTQSDRTVGFPNIVTGPESYQENSKAGRPIGRTDEIVPSLDTSVQPNWEELSRLIDSSDKMAEIRDSVTMGGMRNIGRMGNLEDMRGMGMSQINNMGGLGGMSRPSGMGTMNNMGGMEDMSKLGGMVGMNNMGGMGMGQMNGMGNMRESGLGSMGAASDAMGALQIGGMAGMESMGVGGLNGIGGATNPSEFYDGQAVGMPNVFPPIPGQFPEGASSSEGLEEPDVYNGPPPNFAASSNYKKQNPFPPDSSFGGESMIRGAIPSFEKSSIQQSVVSQSYQPGDRLNRPKYVPPPPQHNNYGNLKMPLLQGNLPKAELPPTFGRPDDIHKPPPKYVAAIIDDLRLNNQNSQRNSAGPFPAGAKPPPDYGDENLVRGPLKSYRPDFDRSHPYTSGPRSPPDYAASIDYESANEQFSQRPEEDEPSIAPVIVGDLPNTPLRRIDPSKFQFGPNKDLRLQLVQNVPRDLTGYIGTPPVFETPPPEELPPLQIAKIPQVPERFKEYLSEPNSVLSLPSRRAPQDFPNQALPGNWDAFKKKAMQVADAYKNPAVQKPKHPYTAGYSPYWEGYEDGELLHKNAQEVPNERNLAPEPDGAKPNPPRMVSSYQMMQMALQKVSRLQNKDNPDALRTPGEFTSQDLPADAGNNPGPMFPMNYGAMPPGAGTPRGRPNSAAPLRTRFDYEEFNPHIGKINPNTEESLELPRVPEKFAKYLSPFTSSLRMSDRAQTNSKAMAMPYSQFGVGPMNLGGMKPPLVPPFLNKDYMKPLPFPLNAGPMWDPTKPNSPTPQGSAGPKNIQRISSFQSNVAAPLPPFLANYKKNNDSEFDPLLYTKFMLLRQRNPYGHLPKVDDYNHPIRWVNFNSNETKDGLAKVTDAQTGQNRVYDIEGSLLVPVLLKEGQPSSQMDHVKKVLKQLNITNLKAIVPPKAKQQQKSVIDRMKITQLRSLPQFDDFKSPVKWVEFNSNDTKDGLAKVTDSKTGKNFQLPFEDTILVPVIDYNVDRLGLTTPRPTIVPSEVTTDQTLLRNVMSMIDFKKIDERDWLAIEAAMGGRNDPGKCKADGCQARCKKDACDTGCTGDTCAAGCVGRTCESFCNGPGCLSMCLGENCSAKCKGMSCDARCRGNGCEATCNGFSCHYVENGLFKIGGGSFSQSI